MTFLNICFYYLKLYNFKIQNDEVIATTKKVGQNASLDNVNKLIRLLNLLISRF